MENIDLDAVTLLYLLKSGPEYSSLLDCAHSFQQTKEELVKVLKQEAQDALNRHIADGTFSF